jgi:hypothetical protein
MASTLFAKNTRNTPTEHRPVPQRFSETFLDTSAASIISHSEAARGLHSVSAGLPMGSPMLSAAR